MVKAISALPQTQRLLEIMEALRDPETGCPWDRKQTYLSIVPYTLEEAYEVADAIESGDYDELHGELGDLLFQVVFYAQIGQEEGRFDFESIAQKMSEKLERRHPHVFADKKYISDDELKVNWERQKQLERQEKKHGQAGVEPANKSLMDELPNKLPALSFAQKMQKRVARHGFDWPSIEGVFDKLEEEIIELKQAIANQDKENIQEEIGDLIFTCVNLARHLDVDAEAALRSSSRKFKKRFRLLENWLTEQQLTIEDASIEQLTEGWEQIKQSA